jgi:uncharacterized membrane protein (UPF0127 family)
MKLISENSVKCAMLCVIAIVLVFTQPKSESAGGGAGTADPAIKVPTVRIGDNVVKVEIASTPQEIEFGLMKRTSLPDDHGMIFLFHPAHHVQFWMYNCLMSLDMLFIKDGKVIRMAENVPPCTSKNPEECPKYPDKPIEVTEVLEVQPGYAKKHHVKEGDKVTFELPDLGQPQSKSQSVLPPISKSENLDSINPNDPRMVEFRKAQRDFQASSETGGSKVPAVSESTAH